MDKTLGQIAFDAYIESRGNRNPDGSPAPLWSELGNTIRDAWEDAAEAVNTEVLKKAKLHTAGKFRF